MDYPISVPSVGLVGGKFVDEDPVSGTVGSLIPSAWGNAVTDELIGVIKAAGLAPSESDLGQVVKAIRTLVGTPVGSMRNGRMSIAAASASATYTADELVLETALGGLAYQLANFNKSLNLTGTGVGGMDTGAAPLSSYVGIYAIYNPATGASGLLAVNATAKVLSNVYSGANMPAGYTASALISVWPTTAAGLLGVGTQLDRALYIVSTSALSTAVQQSTATALTIAGTVPLNAKSCHGTITLTASAASSNLSATLGGSSTNVGLVAFSVTSAQANGGLIVPFPDIPLITPQTLFYTDTCSSGTINFGVGISGYTF